MNASSGFLKRFLHKIFSKMSQTIYERCSQSDKITDPEIKKKDGKNIGVLFKPEPDKMNYHIDQ